MTNTDTIARAITADNTDRAPRTATCDACASTATCRPMLAAAAPSHRMILCRSCCDDLTSHLR